MTFIQPDSNPVEADDFFQPETILAGDTLFTALPYYLGATVLLASELDAKAEDGELEYEDMPERSTEVEGVEQLFHVLIHHQPSAYSDRLVGKLEFQPCVFDDEGDFVEPIALKVSDFNEEFLTFTKILSDGLEAELPYTDWSNSTEFFGWLDEYLHFAGHFPNFGGRLTLSVYDSSLFADFLNADEDDEQDYLDGAVITKMQWAVHEGSLVAVALEDIIDDLDELNGKILPLSQFDDKENVAPVEFDADGNPTLF